MELMKKKIEKERGSDFYSFLFFSSHVNKEEGKLTGCREVNEDEWNSEYKETEGKIK